MARYPNEEENEPFVDEGLYRTKNNVMVDLKTEWINLASKYIDDENQIKKYWDEMDQHYNQKSRHYHDLNHILSILKQCELYEEYIEDMDVLKFAVWYHDIIYKVTQKDNEEKSGEYAVARLQKMDLPKEKIELCKALILATKSHELTQDSETNDFKWLLDFDLSILGSDWNHYELYTQQIRKEYRIYPNFLYNKGRKKVLKKFLDLETIYKTEIYQSKFETQAKSNITKELAQL